MDPIDRQAAIDAVDAIGHIATMPDGDKCIRRSAVKYTLSMLPSAQPEIIHCNDCKHWKDGDGVYRRGFDAESKCPINIHQVYEGTFYCGLAERRTDAAK